MYVCLCKGITDTDIKRELDRGARSLRDVRESLGVGSVCGACRCTAKSVIKEHAQESVNAFDPSLCYQIA